MYGLIFLQSIFPRHAIEAKRKILAAVNSFYLGVHRGELRVDGLKPPEAFELAEECELERLVHEGHMTGYAGKIITIRGILTSFALRQTDDTLPLRYRGFLPSFLTSST